MPVIMYILYVLPPCVLHTSYMCHCIVISSQIQFGIHTKALGTAFCHAWRNLLTILRICPSRHGTQRPKIAEKVHKPPFEVNVIIFEFNGFNASMWVRLSPSESKKV